MIIILLIQSVILSNMLVTLADFYEQQRAIQSLQIGLQKKEKLLSALEHVEHQQSCTEYQYQIETISPQLQQITVQYNSHLKMQSTLKNGKRVSLRIIRD